MSALPDAETTGRPLGWRGRGPVAPPPPPGLAFTPLPAPTAGALAAEAASPWSPLFVSVGLFAATWAALIGLNIFLSARRAIGFGGMNDLLTACAALAAVVLGTLAMAQSRAARLRARDLGVGVAFVLYGAVVLYGGQLYPVGSRATSPQVLGYFPAATLVAVFGMVLVSVSGRKKPATRWSWMSCIELVVILAALTTVLQLTPTVARALTLVALPDPATAGGLWGQLLLAGAWSAVAAASLLREAPGARWRRDMAVAVVSIGLVQGRLALILAPSGASIWVLGSHLFQLVGFAMAFVVVAAELDQRATTERGQLLDSMVAARTDGARRLARQAIEAGHGHDIRSALFAIDGAAQTLVDRFDVLQEADRITLARMVGAGVDRLRVLVKVRMEEIEDFRIDTVVRSVVYSEKRLGVAVTTALPAGLRGVGRAADLAVVLQTLIRSPRICSGDGPVVVRGATQGGAVLLLVEADGLGPDPLMAWSERLDDSLMMPFGRLEPGLALESGGDALDLYVAARLMADQGGDVWTATRPDGGLSFGVRLPASPQPFATGPDETQPDGVHPDGAAPDGAHAANGAGQAS